MTHDPVRHDDSRPGGMARYFVENREVGWLVLLALLVWGAVAYSRLAQQEDPKIPERVALVVTPFPGATAAKVEQLVTDKLEQKIAENSSVEEIKSESRAGVSVIEVRLRPAPEPRINQEWDKLRASLAEVRLPEGCQPPFLDTNFGNTITLLYAVTSPAVSEAECIARAHLLRTRLAAMRAQTGAADHVAAAAFFPPSVPPSVRSLIVRHFVHFLDRQGISDDVQTVQGQSFVLADFATTATREQIHVLLNEFSRTLAGTENPLHPDFGPPIILMGDEDPLPQIRAAAMPRYSYRELEQMAERLEEEIRRVPGAGRVQKIGVVDEHVHLEFSLARLNGFGLSLGEVTQALAARNALIPGGTFSTEGHDFPVQLSGEFADEKELLGAIVGVSSGGAPVYVRDLFEVQRGYSDPIAFAVDVLARPALAGPLERRRATLVAVEMKDGEHIGRFAGEVAAAVGRAAAAMPDGVEILTVSNQPEAVRLRIHQFVKCFVEAIMVVILTALVLMEWRSALIVALAIPLTVAFTLAGMHVMGLPLHQISIAALIIALGMLVDDPVVASDAINRELHHGVPRATAAWLGPFKLRRAIMYATLINIFAFLPLALLPGDTGAFIFALPVVVTLALVGSRLVSMTFIPLLGYYVLRGQKGLEDGGEVRRFFPFRQIDRAISAALPVYRRALEGALRRPLAVIGAAYGILAASFLLLRLVGTQFFPPAERNQFVIDVELPQSASVAQMRRACDEVVAILGAEPQIRSAAVFMGGTAPRFYYNVSPKVPGHFLAQVVVNTRTQEEVPPLVARLRPLLDAQVAGARCVVRQLEQGPPVEAPIQLRFSGPDLDTLRQLADEAAAVLRDAGGYHVHDDLGRRLPTLAVEIDQARANTLGISNLQVGEIVRAAFSGLRVTEIREGDRLIPVSIRLRAEERNEADKIPMLYVESRGGPLIPLSGFASLRLQPEFASVWRHNEERTATVKAFASVGTLPSAVLERARPRIDAISLPDGYRLEYAGEAKEMAKSQSQMMTVIQISLALIALAMVMQFRSVMKSFVVMLTVPLGLIGAFAGLALFQTSFGFMALLAIVSLAGVIVSHIIVLSDFIEEARAEGMQLRQALIQAGLVRLRAVMVTVLATVGGLVPLALTGGQLWRPLTAVHIFGLLGATALTLVMLPALYYVFCARLRWIK